MAHNFETWSPERTVEIITALADLEGPLLPILHEIQETFGCVPPAAVPIIAGALNLSRAEVHGVVSFYHDFRETPAEGRSIKLCRAEACQARGVETLVKAVDGKVAFEPVYCLGLCASGPSALIDGRPVARLTAERLIALAGA
ncbi:NAD(P)H-dependent oxidoreductase subunit E [Phenylobacterium montanum]|uniref:NAD(P)H-dependent oxidoreductase subunit E n=1 Tax=Phenylobacterium montanum TaxID=2823693 RepID=A0A975ITS1_9CAUL|nr:NAD(P)H-dependent oxidoreductase subunit E [Caulobacter sp. S6]QUD87167.1 NAD(P)H-dependent oxidoreductase subunit E [Caulobacter sp. S6]